MSTPTVTDREGRHTELPWAITKAHKPDNVGGWDWAILDPDRKIIAEVYDVVGDSPSGELVRRPSQANAAFIVKAVNAYDELAACVRWAVENDGECLGDWPKILDRFRAALSKASAP